MVGFNIKNISVMRTALLFIFVMSISSLFGQNSKGVIHFKKQTKFIEIMATLPFMTEEDIERDRLTWGNSEGRKQDYLLFFDDKKMTFQESEETENSFWGGELYNLEHTFKKNQIKNNIELLGKKYIVSGDAQKHKWKILNEIKEIAGYLCMKAETFDTTHNRVVTAWFTDAIPVSGGPEGYYGLPGMILELNFGNGCAVITADKVDYKSELEVETFKSKGKKVNLQELNQIIMQYRADQIADKSNPYWQMRY